MCQHVFLAVLVLIRVTALKTHHVRIIRVTVYRSYGLFVVDCPLLSMHYQALMSNLCYPQSKQIL